MIKTIVVCDQCEKKCDSEMMRITLICQMWDKNLDFCDASCLTAWVIARNNVINVCS